MEIEIKKYKAGIKHKEIFEDWKNNKDFEYWRMIYNHKDLIISKVVNGYRSLKVLVPTQ